MTTRTTPAPLLSTLLDAPAIHAERLTAQQRDGRSCAWCSNWASPRHPVPLLRGDARLHACETCAGQYGAPEAEL